MTESLLRYYHEELSYLRDQGEAFAQAHPKVASRLRLGPGHAEDPFVGRLTESFAFLTARIRHKMDHQLEKTHAALLNILYPHYLLPIPSASIVQMTPSPQLDKAHIIPAGSRLSSSTAQGENCFFTTNYPVELLPIKVSQIQLRRDPPSKALSHSGKTKACLSITLSTQKPDISFSKLKPEQLRFYLNLPSSHAYQLYDLLFNQVHDVIISHKGLNQAVHLSPSCIQPVGFADDQGLLPYPAHSFLGYRLLTEYFSFPEKFLFCDFTELSAVFERGFTDEVQIHLLLSQAYPELEGLIDDNAMLLHCSPMINLFEQTGEPITVNQKQYEYHVIADAHRKKESIEIYSINSLKPLGQTELHCLPYFGRKYADSQEQACLYWHSKQKAAWELGAYHMPGNEVFVSFNAANGQLPDNLILSPQLLCTNRDLPSHLPFGGDNPQLQFWHNNSLVKQLRCVAPITKPKYRQRQVQYDRELISHITLNQIGFAEAEDTLNTLKEVLALYHYDDPHSQTAIQQGLVSAEIQYCTERHPTSLKYGFCQGIALTLTIDEKFFPQHIAYLFGSVLNAFFAKSCSINSFTKLTLSSQQRGVIHQWKPQFGHKATL